MRNQVAEHSLFLLLRILLEHLIHFSCVAKRRIPLGKKSKLRHSRDQWRKDINKKKNLEGKTIEHVHLFQEQFLEAYCSKQSYKTS